jgi:hypothetical protein
VFVDLNFDLGAHGLKDIGVVARVKYASRQSVTHTKPRLWKRYPSRLAISAARSGGGRS